MQISFPSWCVTGGQVTPLLNIMLVSVFCQLILFLLYLILLGGFKLVDVVLDIFGVDAKYS